MLAFDFDEAPEGIPPLNADWRREDQEYAVLSTCSSLVTVVREGGARVVQFSHFSVKEFLTSDRLAIAAVDISFYHIPPAPAHTILAQACLGVLLRPDDTTWRTFVQRFPLAEYAVQHWVNHALFENVSSRVEDGIEHLFDNEQPHFSRWVQNCDMEVTYTWLDGDFLHEAAPVYYAAFCGIPDVVEKLIREHPEHIGTRSGPLGTALHAASRMNHLKVVQSLLRRGADVNAPGLWERTPLLFASEWGHLEVVRRLLEDGADADAGDEDDDWTSLHLAARFGHFETVRTLLKYNADANVRNNYRRTPLHLASGSGHVDIVRLLLNHGTDTNPRDMYQQTSLHIVSSTGNLDIARLLLEHGAEVDAEDDVDRTSYQIASSRGHEEIAQLLLTHGAERRTYYKDLIS